MRWRARLLQYAAIQFVVLVAIAMAVFAGGSYYDPTARGYAFTHNFLSDLGATHVWSGRPNTASAVLFAIALGSVGLSLIAFASAWRGYAFRKGRAAGAGHASTLFGTASGACFIGIAATPFDLHMHWHNNFVIAAFGLLLCWVACITVVMGKNDASPRQRRANLTYLAVVVAYVALVVAGPDFSTESGFRTQVIGQKAVVLLSMLYLFELTAGIVRVI